MQFLENNESYTQLNSSYSNAVKFCLTDRGLYSEVCCLLNAVLYCLQKKQRLLVDETKFSGFSWADFFEGNIPIWDPLKDGDIEEISVHKTRRYNMLRSEFRIPFLIFPNKKFETVFEVQSRLSKILCRPKNRKIFSEAPYAAIQLRRGDKTGGYEHNGKIIIESDESGIDLYVDLLRSHGSGLKKVFVLTDDYEAFEEIEAALPELVFHTFCGKEERGYYNKDFHILDQKIKKQRLIDLIRSVDICAGSSLYIGPFRSNPSKFIPLIRGTLKNCYSTDARKHWMP